MARVAVDFVHFDVSCTVGDELPDDHELVRIAPHLFDPPPAPDPVDETAEPIRVRGPLVEPSTPAVRPARQKG